MPKRRFILGNILKDQGRKKTWLANKLGVTYVTVNRWTNQETSPTTDQLFDIVELLGLKGIDDLYE